MQKASDLLLDIRNRVADLGEHTSKADERMKTFEGRMAEVETAVQSRPAVNLPGTGTDDPGQFSFARAVRAIATNNWDSAGYEKEVFEQARRTPGGEQRAASLANDATLGFLVPNTVVDEIIPLLRSKMILDQLGVTMLDGLSGSPIEIPRETGAGTGYWVGENTAVTASDQATDMVRLRPHKAGSLTKLSNTLIRTGGTRVESFVRNSMMETLARTVQTAFFQGIGAAGQPLGVVNQAGVSTFALAGPTVIVLQQLLEEIEAANADTGPMAWAFHPRGFASIRQLAATMAAGGTAPMLTNGDPSKGDAGTLLGWPWYISTDCPRNSGALTSDAFVGNWSEAMLGSWGAMEIAATTEAGDAFAQDQVWVRVIQEVDVALRHAAAIGVGTALPG